MKKSSFFHNGDGCENLLWVSGQKGRNWFLKESYERGEFEMENSLRTSVYG